MDCPYCNKSISSYSLVCAHCGTRILQKDFGKTERPVKSSKDQTAFDQSQPESQGWTNIVMLILIFAAAIGIIFRFQEKFVDHFHENNIFEVSISPEDFMRICQEGIPKTMYFEHQDTTKMNYALEEYAKKHGYPNKAALLQTCAKAAYKYRNGEQE